MNTPICITLIICGTLVLLYVISTIAGLLKMRRMENYVQKKREEKEKREREKQVDRFFRRDD